MSSQIFYIWNDYNNTNCLVTYCSSLVNFSCYDQKTNLTLLSLHISQSSYDKKSLVNFSYYNQKSESHIVKSSYLPVFV